MSKYIKYKNNPNTGNEQFVSRRLPLTTCCAKVQRRPVEGFLVRDPSGVGAEGLWRAGPHPVCSKSSFCLAMSSIFLQRCPLALGLSPAAGHRLSAGCGAKPAAAAAPTASSSAWAGVAWESVA